MEIKHSVESSLHFIRFKSITQAIASGKGDLSKAFLKKDIPWLYNQWTFYQFYQLKSSQRKWCLKFPLPTISARPVKFVQRKQTSPGISHMWQFGDIFRHEHRLTLNQVITWCHKDSVYPDGIVNILLQNTLQSIFSGHALKYLKLILFSKSAIAARLWSHWVADGNNRYHAIVWHCKVIFTTDSQPATTLSYRRTDPAIRTILVSMNGQNRK